MKSADTEPNTQTLRQVEFSLAGANSSCLKSMLFFDKNHLLFGLNSTLKGLTQFVNPQNAEFSLQYGI